MSVKYFGPWTAEHIRTLHALCQDALRLREPILGGLMATPRPYPDLPAALAALDAHPVYSWMQRYIPRTLELAPRDELTHFQLVRDVLHPAAIAMYHLCHPTGDPPTSRDRHMALTTIERLENFLAAGVVTLSNRVRLEMLFDLMTEARVELLQHRPRPQGYPELHGLVATLAGYVPLAGTAWLTELAEQIGYKNFSDETARRYINEALAD